MKKQFIEVGKVVRTHGLNGAVKVEHWCDSSSVFCKFEALCFSSSGDFKKQFKLLSLSDNFLVLKFSGVDSVEKAAEFVNRVLFADRKDFRLPIGTFFVQDLIGSFVVDYLDLNIVYGKIVEVLNYGANDIYKIRNKSGAELLIPAIDDIIIDKRVDENLILIRPMEGLFDV